MRLRQLESNRDRLPRGFVLRCRQDFSGPGQLLSSSCWAGCIVTGTGFDAFVNVLPTTPECVNEEQPLVADEKVLFYEGHLDDRKQVAQLLNAVECGLASDGEVLLRAFNLHYS
jgi:hypothetical protein